MILRRSLSLALLPVLVALVAGCSSSKGVPVNGTLMANGKAYATPDKGQVTIQFTPADPAGKLQPAMGQADPKTGEFSLQSPTFKGVMPGKYKVAVKGSLSGQYDKDLFQNRFNETNTPLVVEVTPSTKSVVVDVGTKSVTAQ